MKVLPERSGEDVRSFCPLPFFPKLDILLQLFQMASKYNQQTLQLASITNNAALHPDLSSQNPSQLESFRVEGAGAEEVNMTVDEEPGHPFRLVQEKMTTAAANKEEKRGKVFMKAVTIFFTGLDALGLTYPEAVYEIITRANFAGIFEVINDLLENLLEDVKQIAADDRVFRGINKDAMYYFMETFNGFLCVRDRASNAVLVAIKKLQYLVVSFVTSDMLNMIAHKPEKDEMLALIF